ncbi:MAG: hypothetical protein MGU50_16390 [Trichodesmium sp. MAG_R02]|nr:hypothetical protein [Trichodesmium sp. MAG_R02]
MHARSLQGFGCDDVVHQFENLYNLKKCRMWVVIGFYMTALSTTNWYIDNNG